MQSPLLNVQQREFLFNDDEGNSSANQTTLILSGSVVDADDARIFFSFLLL